MVQVPIECEKFSALISRIPHLSARSARCLREAFTIAESAYAGKVHWTGGGVLDHTLSVLEALLPYAPDPDAAIACLLHHLPYEKRFARREIATRFGDDVAYLVSGVHLLSHMTTKSRRIGIEQLRLILLRAARDVRVLLIVLCQQSHILDHLDAFSPAEQVRVCRDVLRLFAPVAARLGIYALKHDLESRAFPIVYPTDAQRIREQIDAIHARYGNFLPDSAAQLRSLLNEEGIAADIEGREKQPLSIFRKMCEKTIARVADLTDLFALRVIVADESTCYRVLGLLHRIGHPLANRFKDFIAFPKPNGYKSLHTTLGRLPSVPEGVFVEVQIRTAEMHREAEYGVAAHWSYKEGGTAEQAAQRAAVHRMLLSQPTIADSLFVLTPKGDIVELPDGATPLDFAFAVHTQIGLTFRSARVNGVVVPTTHRLENGDVVEILRWAEARPSPRWVTLLKTASARTRLRRALAARAGAVTQTMAVRPSSTPAAPSLRIGAGTMSTGVALEGNMRMPLQFARCCKPENVRDAIAGVVARTGGVRVHRATCRCLRSVNPGRRIAARWT